MSSELTEEKSESNQYFVRLPFGFNPASIHKHSNTRNSIWLSPNFTLAHFVCLHEVRDFVG